MAITRLLPTGVKTTESFTMANITVTGNVTSGNATLGNLATSNYFHGVFDSTSNAQANITSLGTLNGLAVSGLTTMQQITEVVATPSSTTFDFSTGALFYTTSSTLGANFTPSFTNVPTTDNRMTIVTLVINQGTTPYMPTLTTNANVNGTGYAVKWSSGITPTGRASSLQIITYSLLRTGATWYVSAQGTYYS